MVKSCKKNQNLGPHIRGQNNRTLVKVDNNTDNSNTQNPSETNIMNSNNLRMAV